MGLETSGVCSSVLCGDATELQTTVVDKSWVETVQFAVMINCRPALWARKPRAGAGGGEEKRGLWCAAYRSLSEPVSPEYIMS